MTQGMFDLGAAIGGIPAQAKEAQRKKDQQALAQGLFGLEQSALAGELTPEMYKEAVGSYTALMQQNPEQADEIRKSLARVGASVREQDKAQKKVTAVNELSAIETEYTKIYSDPSLDTKERDARATALRTRAKAIQDANPLVDFSSFSNWDSRAMNAGMAISSRVQNQEAEVEQQKVNATLQGMTPKEREDYVEKYAGSESEYVLRRVNSLNTYEDGVQRRSEEAATREQNLTTEIDSLSSEIETLPEGLRDSLNRELQTVQKMQEGNYKNGRWISKALQNQANNKLNDVSRRIINHSDRVDDADRRSIREADIKITALESQLDNPVMDQKILDRYAESAAQQAGESRSFDKLSASKKEKYYDKARDDILRDHNQSVNSQIRTQKAVKRYLSGEVPEEQAPAETTTEYSSLIKTAQRESGLSRENTIKALKNKGDLPKDYTGEEKSFEDAIRISEEEAIAIWFGEEGKSFDLIETIKKGVGTSLSKAAVNKRVYSKFTDGSGGDLRGVPTNDLELLRYDNNKYTPRIEAELKRRGR
jgi:hypothetical protein